MVNYGIWTESQPKHFFVSVNRANMPNCISPFKVQDRVFKDQLNKTQAIQFVKDNLESKKWSLNL